MLKFLGIESKAEKERKEREAAEKAERERKEREIAAEKERKHEARAARINPEAVATLSGHTPWVGALAPLSNGQLASGASDSTIKIWNISGERCVSTLLGHTDCVRALTSLSNGQLASGSGDKSIKIWDIAGERCVSTLLGHTKNVNSLTLLSDSHLASGSSDSTIKIWDIAAERCVSTLENAGDTIALTQLSNGHLVSGTWGQQIKVWDVLSGSCVKIFSRHSSPVHALTTLSNGYFASGSSDNDDTNEIHVWSDYYSLTGLSGHRSAVRALKSLSDGYLASGSIHGTISIWDIASRRCVSTLIAGSGVVALTELSDGYLASGLREGTIKVWDLGLRPVLAPQAAAIPRAASQPQLAETSQAVREGIPLSPPRLKAAVMPASILPPTPLKSAATTGASAASERDSLPPVGGLSLSHVAEAIAFEDLEIGRKLGQGGFGVVNEALWQGVTQVAVKQLLGQLDPNLLDEFQRETAVHARLHHPNIIQLYGICIEPLKYAMVMEFMASGSLYDVLKNSAELPWSLRLSMALDLTSGILYLHTQHIIHRDLKSLNILVDGHMRAKVSDFGLSKIKLTTASMTKGAGGTPHWMAPELFDEAANSEASDVYATGIVFWEIAARKLPYENKNPSQLMRFVEKGNRETIPSGTPSSFSALMTRCWAQRAGDRPSMSDIARDMREMQAAGMVAVGKSGTSAKAPPSSGYAAFSR